MAIHIGSGGNDTMRGRDRAADEYRDVMYGRDGDDHMVGGPGLDRMAGGPGDDTCEFVRASDSYLPDGIVGFEGAGRAVGEVIDLRGVDADATLAGNQAFAFHGATPRRSEG